ncbi:hypothetical protein D3C78_1778240 [compost metagenome]
MLRKDPHAIRANGHDTGAGRGYAVYGGAIGREPLGYSVAFAVADQKLPAGAGEDEAAIGKHAARVDRVAGLGVQF